MTQYLRYASVTADESTDFSNLRCRFTISQWTLQTPNILKLIISNPEPSRAKRFVQKEYKHIVIDAGYQDGHGVIFQGNIIQAIYGRESPTDTIVTVYAADGDHAHNYATVNTTFPPGSTPKQHFDAAVGAMAKYGVSKGYVGVDLSTPVFPRAVTLFGMARDVLANIAQSKRATVSYQNEKVTIVENGQAAPGGAIKLNSETGLIGMPSQTIQGIYARCLIDPAIKVHSLVQINQKDIQGLASPIIFDGVSDPTFFPALIAEDGIYVVYRIDVDGDTRGNEWYQDLVMLSPHQIESGPPVPTALIPYI